MIGDRIVVASGAVKALVYFETSLLTVSIAFWAFAKTFVSFLDEFVDVFSVHVGLEFLKRNIFIFAFKTNKHRFRHLGERPEARS